ncbi:hypothetical protein NOR_06950 [Metarhizium rileyi]|uniref:Uncharacterized protein n=1 Tax=Metarhizium rileyi (strain RCEF 4871) TaxID=1649241 RepID=A0A166ZFQ6_METRR|nr:hypothetical protein NOR_06950 [Metarhizium rileyi RCEF 4871]
MDAVGERELDQKLLCNVESTATMVRCKHDVAQGINAVPTGASVSVGNAGAMSFKHVMINAAARRPIQIKKKGEPLYVSGRCLLMQATQLAANSDSAGRQSCWAICQPEIDGEMT